MPTAESATQSRMLPFPIEGILQLIQRQGGEAGFEETEFRWMGPGTSISSIRTGNI